ALRITGEIMAYARLGHTARGEDRVDLGVVLCSLYAESRKDMAKDGIVLAVSAEGDLAVVASESHLHSIFKNLVVNARDAVLGEDRPRITIEARRRDDRVVATVTDNGVGISRENLGRIFDPFFTTKLMTGTGLGLGVVQKLTTLYDGIVSVDS